ncbi:uncharacterized protein B0I36DRAFT_315927 [Microdochium trichocladiopsis]|uniref:F-box domain-containing protein n=1 Tax=Microdochium trichocladiopsis TaxID=1682393 RepID=A0A9P9BYQ6_9PEZI|nr:uncharacterized protein B0I36DRAFT_315927 [Microdochium trichocladiopsis]KAH7038278.1 hypothetical protein B0I36DRAFT_315927 [Microdochium trichocladiopsis]
MGTALDQARAAWLTAAGQPPIQAAAAHHHGNAHHGKSSQHDPDPATPVVTTVALPAQPLCIAGQRVLQTPELFELILEHVDMATLLTAAQRVNRYWAKFIRESPKLQRVLFFLSDDGEFNPGHGTDCRRNPLLARFFPGLLAVGQSDAVPDMSGFAAQPFCQRLDVFMRPSASWRNMLIVQRLRERQQQHSHLGREEGIGGRGVGVWSRTRSQGGDVYASSTLYTTGKVSHGGTEETSTGMTMGRLYDLAISHILDECSVTVYWPGEYEAFVAVEDVPREEGDDADEDGLGLSADETDNTNGATSTGTPETAITSRDFRREKRRLAKHADVIWAVSGAASRAYARDYDAVQEFTEKFMHDEHRGTRWKEGSVPL